MIVTFKKIISILLSAYLTAFLSFPATAQVTNMGDVGQSLQSGSSSTEVKSLVKESQVPIQGAPNQSVGGGGLSSLGMGASQTINVHVLGDVLNPGVYKADLSSRALDIARLASPVRSNFRILRVTSSNGGSKQYDLYQYYYNGNLQNNPYLQDNDVIYIPTNSGAVRVEGPVARPGVFEINREKNLSEVIKLSGGFTNAVSKMSPIKVIRFSDGGERFVLDVVQTKSHMDKFTINKGDIIVVPDVVNTKGKFDYSVESIPGENLVYPTSVPDVFVIGFVNSPGPFPYRSHFRIKDYLGYAGAGAGSNLRSVYVYREGKRRSRRVNDIVQAGDVIMVRQRGSDTFFKYLGIASTIMSFTLSAIVFKDVVGNQ